MPLGLLAGALSPVPGTGPVQALAALLTAAGLADPGTAAPWSSGSTATRSSNCLIDPAQQLASAFAQAPALAAAYRGAGPAVRRLSSTEGVISPAASPALTLTADLGAEPPVVTASFGRGGFALGGRATYAALG